MRKLNSIILWIGISLILQLGGLVFLDKYYLTSDATIKSIKIDAKKDQKKRDNPINIDESATDRKFSFDGRYLAYFNGNDLEVLNTSDGKIKNVDKNPKIKILYYNWLNDRNRMLVAERQKSDDEQVIQLSYYDVNKDEKQKIVDLDGVSLSANIEQVKASTLTNVIYVKVSNNGRNSIYRIDINHNLTKVAKVTTKVGNIEVVPHEDRLVYDDEITGSIFATSPNIRLNFSNKNTLLAVDSEDIVYVGEVNNEKITKICYGRLDEPTPTWKVVELGESVDKNSIHITQNGNIFVNNNFKGEVRDVLSGKIFKYNGHFLEIYDEGIGSTLDGKLYKTLFQ
ncbi:hypothetical protein CPJCM30710_29760 [Clostridium polyendosporum]|uniref:Dipeptidyl peptidase IV n=1 Tax=Clostridium polyendosporum TaxID=69208 RepID=A0A919S304_9CLOT|nr:hypothetical protein [Clostridium polyendosporum]GIM30310.1 hypothetical protein CPJCM30710_29760 [Clostridium polyendosporum]